MIDKILKMWNSFSVQSQMIIVIVALSITYVIVLI